MSVPAIAIQRTGLVTAVGQSSPASCAALRAKLTNPTETRFRDSRGEWIMAHQVFFEQPSRGLGKLARMAAMSIDEVLVDIERDRWDGIPLLLCVAEAERPGRTAGLDDELFLRIQAECGARFSPRSGIVAHGRVGVAVALAQARTLLAEGAATQVVVAATDSLLSWPTLQHFEQNDRLLTQRNSNGFVPGEAAGALLLGVPQGRPGELVCSGIGFAREAAHQDSGEPLRGDGLSQAIKAALAEAGCAMHDIDYRITDLSGEHYYFKEASLALSRTLRVRKEEFDIWHPAECIGEVGAAAGTAVLALAEAACRKGFGPGPSILVHVSNDAGQRAALTLRKVGP